MNGAAAVLERKISTPSRSMTITIGSSHHFLFCFRNAQNSLRRLSLCCSAAISSNSVVGFGGFSLMGFPGMRGGEWPVLNWREPKFVLSFLLSPFITRHYQNCL